MPSRPSAPAPPAAIAASVSRTGVGAPLAISGPTASSPAAISPSSARSATALRRSSAALVVGAAAGVDQDQPGDPIRVRAQHRQRDVAAHRDAADDGPLDALVVQRRHHVLGEQREIRLRRRITQCRAGTEAAEIRGQQVGVLGDP